MPPANSSREKAIRALTEEIAVMNEIEKRLYETKFLTLFHSIFAAQDLMTKEQSGECVTWPSELSSLEKVFTVKLNRELPKSNPNFSVDQVRQL